MPDRGQPHVGQHHAAQREVVVQIVSGEIEIESAFELADRPAQHA